MIRGGEAGGDVVHGEVDGHEGDLRCRQSQPGEALDLVSLGGGMIDLEPAHPRLGVARGPPVIAGGCDHHLSHAALQGADHHPVEELGARRQVPEHEPRGPTPAEPATRCAASET